MARKTDGYGTFTFDNVELLPGENTVEAVSTVKGRQQSDRVIWHLEQ